MHIDVFHAKLVENTKCKIQSSNYFLYSDLILVYKIIFNLIDLDVDMFFQF